MKSLKKSAIFCLCFLVFGILGQNANAVGVNYGVTNELTLGLTTTFAYQYRVSPWVEVRSDKLSGWRFVIQGSGYIRYNPDALLFRPIIDLDLFRISTPKVPFLHGYVTWDIGRFLMADTHAMIINDKIDGISTHLVIPGMVMDFTAGYLGFQNNLTSKAMISTDDMLAAAARKDRVYGLGARRAVFQWSTLFPEFIGRTAVYGDMIAQVDMRSAVQQSRFSKVKENAKEEVSSVYIGTGFSGPWSKKNNRLLYDFGIVGEILARSTSSKGETFMAAYLNGGFTYLLSKNKQLAFRLQYGTPNNDDGWSEYRPITYVNAGTFYKGGFANLLKPQIDFRWKINPSVSMNAGLASYIQPKLTRKIVFKREEFEKYYRYTELNLGGQALIMQDINMKGEFVVGVTSEHENRIADVSLRVTLNVGL